MARKSDGRGKRRTLGKLLELRLEPGMLTPVDVDVLAETYCTFDVAEGRQDKEMLEALEGGANAIYLRGLAMDRYARDTKTGKYRE